VLLRATIGHSFFVSSEDHEGTRAGGNRVVWARAEETIYGRYEYQ